MGASRGKRPLSGTSTQGMPFSKGAPRMAGQSAAQADSQMRLEAEKKRAEAAERQAMMMRAKAQQEQLRAR
jgi:hypothetical protein